MTVTDSWPRLRLPAEVGPKHVHGSCNLLTIEITAAWRSSRGEVACIAEDLGSVPLAGCEPVSATAQYWFWLK